MNNRTQVLKYLIFDYLSAVVAWAILFLARKFNMENTHFEDVNLVFSDRNFWVGIIFIPAAWLCLYALQGAYRDVFRKSRLKELQQTVAASIIGVIVIFFSFLLDDAVASYRYYYLSFSLLLIAHFTLTYL